MSRCFFSSFDRIIFHDGRATRTATCYLASCCYCGYEAKDRYGASGAAGQKFLKPSDRCIMASCRSREEAAMTGP